MARHVRVVLWFIRKPLTTTPAQPVGCTAPRGCERVASEPSEWSTSSGRTDTAAAAARAPPSRDPAGVCSERTGARSAHTGSHRNASSCEP